jgi:hypothetical protein
MTTEEIAAHEKDWRVSVTRHDAALRAYQSAEKALAAARANLTVAERERSAEWQRLSEHRGSSL